jgi:hypothetical protein
MKEEISIKDIFFLYVSVVLICWIIGLKYQEKKSHDEKIEIMKIALENDKLNKEYISILQESRDSLEIDYNFKNSELEDVKNMNRIIKDLATVSDYKLIIALCYPENRFNYERKHKDKKITGLVCGVKSYWIDIIPELNNNNINTLKGGEMVLNYLLEKNDGDLFEALKDFKGSDKNIYPVLETLNLYKEIR